MTLVTSLGEEVGKGGRGNGESVGVEEVEEPSNPFPYPSGLSVLICSGYFLSVSPYSGPHGTFLSWDVTSNFSLVISKFPSGPKPLYQRYCGLNVCVSSKCICWSPNVCVMVLEGGAFGR